VEPGRKRREKSSGGSRNFEQGEKENVSATSSFIANAQNEAYAFYAVKGGLRLIENKFSRQLGTAVPTASSPLNPPLKTSVENFGRRQNISDLNESFDVVEMIGAFARLVQTERHVIRQNGKQVDGVEGAFEELTLAGRRPQPQNVLEGEPADAGRFQVDQVLVVNEVVVGVTTSKGRHCVESETNHGRYDKED